MDNLKINIGTKCAPEIGKLTAIQEARLGVVELYTNSYWLRKPSKVINLCKKFPFRYAIHDSVYLLAF